MYPYYTHVKPAHIQYLMSACEGLACGEAPKPLQEPPFPPMTDDRLEFVCEQLDNACKGGMTSYLMQRSTFPTTLDDLAAGFDIPKLTLSNWILLLKNLQDSHVLAENYRLASEKYEREAREARLNSAVAERIAMLSANLSEMREEYGWYEVTTPEAILQTLEPSKANRLRIVKAILSQQYSSMVPLAQALDISRSRTYQVLDMTFRRWRHPMRYGKIFKLESEGGLAMRKTELRLIDPGKINADGHMTWNHYSGLTLAEALEKINEFLALLGTSLKVYCR